MVHAPLFLQSVDLFAGGGGVSEAIKNASGKAPLVAVNHDAHAIAMHARNHPDTLHFQQDVFDVDPAQVLSLLPSMWAGLDLLWASPDCTHHSRAKGSKPLSSGRRALADVVVKWARRLSPRVIGLENVAEFLNWGPLYPEDHPDAKLRGRPIPERREEHFKAWCQKLRDLGYVIEWRVLKACDYGTPTTRARLFLVARRDGQPIVWPKPTHGPGLKPYRTAAECIDWSIPCPSIFTRKRPLAEKTQARIAEGIRRFVLNGKPFLVDIANQTGRGRYVYSADEPVRTMTTKASHCVVAPALISTRNGERPGQAPRCRSVEEPMLTVTAKGSQGGLVATHLVKVNHGRDLNRSRSVDQPLTTVTSKAGHALVATFLAKHNGGKHGAVGQTVSDPMHTVTSRDSKALVSAHLTKFYGSCKSGVPLTEPMPTVTAGGGRGGGHMGLVAAFLIKFYGSGGQWSGLDEPMHTVVTKARMGLVTVDIEGETYALVDIGMRMLQPRELATAQGFGPEYILTGSKAQQTARIGNSVCPPVAQALIESNFGGAGCPDAVRIREVRA
jgi:DNA (cytosine-5)-methyltransferase 1